MGFAKTAEPFVCGGSAATFASVIIHPIDLAKVCFTISIGWKRVICAATHGTQCTYVSRQAQSAGNDRKKSAGGLIGG